MAQRKPRLRQPGTEELLRLARTRVALPDEPLWVEYEADVDTLYIRLKAQTAPTHSDSDIARGLVYDYEESELVGIEILDISGQQAYANPT